MIPSNFGAVLGFFLFVAPGILFDLLADRWRAGIPETAFREVSRVVLASTAFTLVAALFLSAVAFAFPQSREWMSMWISGQDSFRASPPQLLAAAALVTATACVLVWLSSIHLSRGATRLRQMSSWSRVLRTETPEGAAPYVRIKTSSGSVYTGFVGAYTPDLDHASREIVLVPPLWSAGPGKDLQPIPNWSRVILRGDEVAVLMVDYRPDPSIRD